MIKSFEGKCVAIIVVDEKLLFKTEDVAKAVGYSSISGIDYHIKGTRRDVIKNGVRYLTLAGIDYLAKKANRTPKLKAFSLWAKQHTIIAASEADQSVKPNKAALLQPKFKVTAKEHYNITECAFNLSMNVTELTNWLVDEGYAERYISNGAVHWKPWFKTQGYGTLRVIGAGLEQRTSNVPLVTASGFEFIKNRLASKRETGVLMFAKQESSERERLEAELDETIVQVFAKTLYSQGYSVAFFDEYRMNKEELLKYSKQLLAEVKLKEKN